MEPGDLTEDAIRRIYDSVLDREKWNELPISIARLVGAHTCAIYYETGLSIRDVVTFNLADAAPDYVSYFHGVDPWGAAARRRRRLVATPGDELVPQDRYAESEFYRDFARHWGMFHLLGGHHPLSGAAGFNLALHRPRDAPAFDAGERRLVDTLLPHLQRALQLRKRLEDADATAAIGYAGLDALGFAAIVCDGRARVLFANAEAERLEALGAGLRLAGGLRGRNADETRGLRRLVANAAVGGSGGALKWTLEGGSDLAVLVTRLPAPASERAGGEGLALVTARGPQAQTGSQRAVLTMAYGLSPIEADLALALAAGKPLAEIAAERGVAMLTVRTQLRNAFAKTGCRSQRDLVALLAALPAIA